MAVDLVLSSGWLAFAAHCGFLAGVTESDVDVDGVCGTSSGALTGALWAAGHEARDILDILTARRPLAWVRPHGRPWEGLLGMEPMIAELRRRLPARFEDLPRPFAVGVIQSDRSFSLLREGPLPEAVAASCAVPWLFRPVHVGGVAYADGGATDRLGLEAWRAWRPDCDPLVHLIDRTAGAPTPVRDATVVSSPRSGAQLWSLGDVPFRFERARHRTCERLRG